MKIQNINELVFYYQLSKLFFTLEQKKKNYKR